MTWHKQFLSENNKSKSLSSKNNLFKLIAEVYSESFTEKEREMISEDFFENTLTEIFSGIDYSKISRSINENKSIFRIPLIKDIFSLEKYETI